MKPAFNIFLSTTELMSIFIYAITINHIIKVNILFILSLPGCRRCSHAGVWAGVLLRHIQVSVLGVRSVDGGGGG